MLLLSSYAHFIQIVLVPNPPCAALKTMHADPTLLSESKCLSSNIPLLDFMSIRSSDHKVELQKGVKKRIPEL